MVDRNPLPLPLEIEEIDADWLTAALRTRAPGATVKSFEITKTRRGFTTIIWLKLELDEAARKAGIPESMILKGGFEPHSRTRARTYMMEAIGYRDVWPKLGMRTPTCYFAEAEPDRAQSIVLMEDLSTRGVKFHHGLQPVTYEQMERRLVSLAAIHARTWGPPEKVAAEWPMVVSNGVRMARTYMENFGFLSEEGWRKMLDQPRGAAIPIQFHDREWFIKALLHLEKLADTIPNCVIHGDTHLGNLYEDPDGEPGYFDGIPRREPAHFELAYTMTCGFDFADRRKHEHSLIRRYVQELARHGVETDLEEVTYYYRLFLQQGYCYFIMNDNYFQTESFNTAHTARFCHAMLDNGSKELFDGAFRSMAL